MIKTKNQIKILIADISCFSYKGKPTGHYWKTAKYYKNILKQDFNVIIGGSKEYFTYFDKSEILKFRYSNRSDDNYTLYDTFTKIIKEILNIKKAFSYECDIIIFQSCALLSICIALFFIKTNKKIILIQYTNLLKYFKYRILYKFIKNKISGIITSIKDVGKSYSNNYLVIPDYIYEGETNKVQYKSKFIYDFCVIGNIGLGKDIEDIVNVMKKTKYSVIIAGHFNDINRFNNLLRIKSDNIKIINKFISYDKYINIIQNSKYVILPYKEYYNNASSGVVFDAIFNETPVISTKVNSLNFITKYNLGYQYKVSIKEFLNINIDYNLLRNNIIKYLKKNEENGLQLIEFMKNSY